MGEESVQIALRSETLTRTARVIGPEYPNDESAARLAIARR